MLLVLFILWIVLNGWAGGDVLATGLLAVGGVCWFCRRYLDYRPENDLTLFKNIGKLTVYGLHLIWQMFLANVQVIRLVLSPEIKVDPCLISFETRLKTSVGRVMLANSITLTPGTITADLTEGRYWVHALTREMVQGIEECCFVELIGGMEENR